MPLPNYAILATSRPTANEDIWGIVCEPAPQDQDGPTHQGQHLVAPLFFMFEQRYNLAVIYAWGMVDRVDTGRAAMYAQGRNEAIESLNAASRSARQVLDSLFDLGQSVLIEQYRVVRDVHQHDLEDQGGPAPPYAPPNTTSTLIQFGDVPRGPVPSYTPFNTLPVYDAQVESWLGALASTMEAVISGLRSIKEAHNERAAQRAALLGAIHALRDRLVAARVALNELVPIAAGVIRDV